MLRLPIMARKSPKRFMEMGRGGTCPQSWCMCLEIRNNNYLQLLHLPGLPRLDIHSVCPSLPLSPIRNSLTSYTSDNVIIPVKVLFKPPPLPLPSLFEFFRPIPSYTHQLHDIFDLASASNQELEFHLKSSTPRTEPSVC